MTALKKRKKYTPPKIHELSMSNTRYVQGTTDFCQEGGCPAGGSADVACPGGNVVTPGECNAGSPV